MKLNKNQMKVLGYLVKEKDGKKINNDTISSILKMKWEDFEDAVNSLVKNGYITKPFYADDTIYTFSSTITTLGMINYSQNKINLKKTLYKWTPIVCAIVSAVIAVYTLLN